MEIKIDQEAVQDVVKKAILDQLGEDRRELLIAAALEHLLTTPPKGDRYSTYQQPSPLQQAFNEAVAAAAREIVKEEVATDEEFKAKVRAKVGEALMLVDETRFSSFVSDALAAALDKKRYE